MRIDFVLGSPALTARVEGASIDKQSHESEADRTIWDTIEFDNAVKVAMAFAHATNTDAGDLSWLSNGIHSGDAPVGGGAGHNAP